MNVRRAPTPTTLNPHVDVRCKSDGRPNSVVRQVLPCVDSGEAPPALLDQLVAERVRIDHRITDRLDDVIAITRDPDSDCPHVE